eukprot:TRINITY_DN7757_c0_g1_i7.p1 TRINITY_DN7757_c0_g1~~TRINITY_DN7757_c0_g1_i7.p1  ORF type:complete len:2090 (+),score=305.37 TRINITY_DN7757_c0_g1_i7:142-6270(+)
MTGSPRTSLIANKQILSDVGKRSSIPSNNHRKTSLEKHAPKGGSLDEILNAHDGIPQSQSDEVIQDQVADLPQTTTQASLSAKRDLIGKSSDAFYRRMSAPHTKLTLGLPLPKDKEINAELVFREENIPKAQPEDLEQLSLGAHATDQERHMAIWAAIEGKAGKRSRYIPTAPPFQRPLNDWKTVRIWVASSGLDTLAERVAFRNIVMPELRAKCQAIRIHLVDCDIRFGVNALQSLNGLNGIESQASKEESAEIQSDYLRIVMREFEKCMACTATNETKPPHNMFIVAFVGQKYGWVPSKKVLETSQAQEFWKWRDGFSLLAMELLNGAYLHGNPNAFLYVRSPELFKSKETFVGMDQMERKQAELELALQLTEMFEDSLVDDESMFKKNYLKRFKLDMLIAKLKSRFPHENMFVNYPCKLLDMEDDGDAQRGVESVRLSARLAGLEELCKTVTDQVWAALESYFPIDANHDINYLQLSNAQRSVMAKKFANTIVGRQSYLSVLNQYHSVGNIPKMDTGLDKIGIMLPKPAEDEEQEQEDKYVFRPLLVVGDSGIGKTHILATFLHKIKQTENSIILGHFTMFGSDTRDLCAMLTRFCETLEPYVKAFDHESEASTSLYADSSFLSQRLKFYMSRLPKHISLLIIVDGAEMLLDQHRRTMLSWIPESWVNERVRIIVSCQICSELKTHIQQVQTLPYILPIGILNMDERVGLTKAIIKKLNFSTYPFVKEKDTETPLPGFIGISDIGLLRISALKKSGNPLNLILTVNCIYNAILDSSSEVSEDFLISNSPRDLDAICVRLIEQLGKRCNPKMLHLLLSLTLASENGLLEMELRDLCRNVDGTLSAYDWANLVRCASTCLSPWMIESEYEGLCIPNARLKSALATHIYGEGKQIQAFRKSALWKEVVVFDYITQENSSFQRVNRQLEKYFSEQASSIRDSEIFESHPRSISQAKYYGDVLDRGSSITLALRLRPIFTRETSEDIKVGVFIKQTQLILNAVDAGSPDSHFSLDCHIDSSNNSELRSRSQQNAFSAISKSILTPVHDGKNVTVMAYGPLGTGKTFTLFGDSFEDGFASIILDLILKEMNTSMTQFQIRASFLEIYEEEICDLLRIESIVGKTNAYSRILKLASPFPEDATSFESICGATALQITDMEHFRKVLRLGMISRFRDETDDSSQSVRISNANTILQIEIKTMETTSSYVPSEMNRVKSKSNFITLIDLACSNYIPPIEQVDRLNFLESDGVINKSLRGLVRYWSVLARGRVPSEEASKGQFSYQESKLTMMIKSTLKGLNHCVCIFTMTPSSKNLLESHQTMQAAMIAKKAKRGALQIFGSQTPDDVYSEAIQEAGLYQSLSADDIAVLTLRPQTIPRLNAMLFYQALKYNNSLHTLRLLNQDDQSKPDVRMDYSVEIVRALSEFIRESKSLRTLVIQCSMGDCNVQYLADAMRESSSLNTFQLQCPELGLKGAMSISSALTDNPSIKKIVIRQGYVGAWQTPIARWLSFNFHVVFIDLSYQDLTNRGKTMECVKRLSSLLSSPSSLAHLLLRKTNLGVKGVHTILEGVMKSHNIRELDLSENDVEPAMAAVILMLKDHPSLSTLHLAGCYLSLSSATRLGDVIAKNPVFKKIRLNTLIYANSFRENSITSLNWSEEPFADTDVCILATLLGVNESLLYLDLRNSVIGSDTSHKLSDAVCSHKMLAKITLNHNTVIPIADIRDNKIDVVNISNADPCWGDLDVLILCTLLKSNKSLRVVDIHRKELSVAAAFAISQAISVNTTMNSVSYNSRSRLPLSRLRIPRPPEKGPLDFASISFDTVDMIVWSGFLKQSPLGITELDLSPSDICIHDVSGICLADALIFNKVIKILDLSCNGLTDKSGVSLALALRANPCIEELNLSFNNFGEVTANAFAVMLTKNFKLRVLDLSFNFMDFKAATALCEGLKGHSTLELLDLRGNHIGDKGALAVGKMLKRNRSLLGLSIAGNSIREKGATAIGQALWHNKILKSIDLSYNRIGDKGLIVLAEAMRYSASLEVVDLECQLKAK